MATAIELADEVGLEALSMPKLAKRLGSWSYDSSRGDPKSIAAELSAAGFDPERPRIRLFAEMWRRIHNLPRHLGQHSGGMVIARGRLDEVVPLEPAAMEGRTVIQWDKDDLDALGLLKVDVLALGMLSAVHKTFDLVAEHEGRELLLAAAALIGGLYAYYYYENDIAQAVRVLMVLAGTIIGVGIAMTSTQGQRLWHFIQGSRVEIRKVVWPTRAETTQTALAVLFVVVLMGVVLWLLDMFLLWAIRLLTGQGG